MKQIILALIIFITITNSQNTANCSGTPVQIRLISPTSFAFYYSVGNNCSYLPKVDYCELSSCTLRGKAACYAFEIVQQYNQTKCKESCCLGIWKADKKLFDDLGCNSVDFAGKEEIQRRSKEKSEVDSSLSNANATANSTQDDANNSTLKDAEQKKSYSVALIIAFWASIFTIFCVSCCKCYNSQKFTSNIAQHQIQAEINTQRGLNPIKQKPQQLKQKLWQLPDTKYSCKEVKLLEQECTICLGGQPNCTLDCDHGFHKECIIQWLQRVCTCPLCKSSKISHLAVRCNRCMIYRYTCTFAQLKLSFETEDVCQACNKPAQ